MTPKRQIQVLWGISIVGAMVTCPLSLTMFRPGAYWPSPAFFMAWLGFTVVWVLVLLAVPLHCDSPGCNGSMQRKWIKDAAAGWRLQYECRLCHHLVDPNIPVVSKDAWR